MTFLIEPKLFAENMRYFRKKQPYSIKELATLSGLTTTVIQTLEQGVAVPNEAQLTNIARALKLAKTDLVLPRPHEMEYYESC